LRASVCARDEYVLPGGALLRLELRELGTALDGLRREALDLARRGVSVERSAAAIARACS
jgi:hypothetical protein